MKAKICSINIWKKKNKNKKLLANKWLLKKLPFVNTRIFFSELPNYLTSIWFVRFTCVDDRKINPHSMQVCQEVDHILPVIQQLVHQNVFLMDTFSEFGNWVPWKREKWHNWKATLQVEMSPPKRKCGEEGMFLLEALIFSVCLNVIMWPFNVTYSCTE